MKKGLSILFVVFSFVLVLLWVFTLFVYPGIYNNIQKERNRTSNETVSEKEEMLTAKDYVTLSDYVGIETGVALKEVTADAIENEITSFVEQQGGIYDEVTNAKAKKGDRLTISFYKIEHEEDMQPLTIILGKQDYAPELDTELEGKEVGSETNVTIENGDTYYVRIDKIEVPGEVTDDYIKNLQILARDGSPINTLDELKEDIEGFLKEMYTAEYNEEVKAAVKAKIIEGSTYNSLPENIVGYFEENLKDRVEDLKKSSELENPTDYDVLEEYMKGDEFVGTPEDYIKWNAEMNTKEYLSMLYISQKDNITISRDDVLSLAAETWQKKTDEYPTLSDFIKNKNIFPYEAAVLEGKVIEYAASLSKEGLLEVENKDDVSEDSASEDVGSEESDNTNP